MLHIGETLARWHWICLQTTGIIRLRRTKGWAELGCKTDSLKKQTRRAE